MIFSELANYDLRRNLLTKPIKWAAVAAVFAFYFFLFHLDALHSLWSAKTLEENVEILRELRPSFGDGMLYLTGGMLPLTVTSLADNFQFPVRWLLPHILILYLTLSYAGEDLSRGGLQVLTRAGSKSLWWLSKCLWNVLTVFSCFAVGTAVWYLLCALSGEAPDLFLHEVLFRSFFEGELSGNLAGDAQVFLALCVMPALVCMTISLVQMTLTLFLKPVFAYCIVCAYFIAGAYCASPVFLSNYAMSSRSAALGLYNFRISTGLVLCLAVSAAAVWIGALRLRKMDLLG